jgi:hypothetical protein
MCAPNIIKGSVCSVCVILPFAGPFSPGYAPGYFLCSGCISLSRVFTVEGVYPLGLPRSVLLYILSLGRYHLVQFQFSWRGRQYCQFFFAVVNGLLSLC